MFLTEIVKPREIVALSLIREYWGIWRHELLESTRRFFTPILECIDDLLQFITIQVELLHYLSFILAAEQEFANRFTIQAEFRLELWRLDVSVML